MTYTGAEKSSVKMVDKRKGLKQSADSDADPANLPVSMLSVQHSNHLVITHNHMS